MQCQKTTQKLQQIISGGGENMPHWNHGESLKLNKIW
jgi:hypothetical protein